MSLKSTLRKRICQFPYNLGVMGETLNLLGKVLWLLDMHSGTVLQSNIYTDWLLVGSDDLLYSNCENCEKQLILLILRTVWKVWACCIVKHRCDLLYFKHSEIHLSNRTLISTCLTDTKIQMRFYMESSNNVIREKSVLPSLLLYWFK